MLAINSKYYRLLSDRYMSGASDVVPEAEMA
jgi:hypothetical protein